MAKKRYSPSTDTFAVPETATRLPVDKPIAIYYRQSTLQQIGNISTAIQTVDMVAYLKRCGWREHDIILIDMDEGISGSKKIDERPGMSMLFELICDGKVGAVACQDEDRLFRDVTQIQVNIFIEACRSAQILVLTPSMVYDFANALMGSFYIHQFRFKSEMAAEYINSYIIGRLHRAKQRMAHEGRWVGPSMPPGYMIDTRKTLEDGRFNENWRRFVPFEPYAAVVNEYFRMFLASGGSLAATLRHIHKEGVPYPDPAVCKPPQGYKVRYGFRRHGMGFFPSRTALTTLLTNAAYVGHWLVNGAVVRWDNHPAIVPTDVFTRAFNYLSEYTLDGEPNLDYRPFQENIRPSLDEERPVERPLCSGMIVSDVDGRWVTVGTEYVKREQHYRYLLITVDVFEVYQWSKHADAVDHAVCKFLHERLHETFDSEVWMEQLDALRHAFDRARKLKCSQRTALEGVMENIIGNLETATIPEMVKRMETRYEETQQEHRRLTAVIEAMDKESQVFVTAAQFKDTYEPLLTNWETIPHYDKRVLLHAFIDHIEAKPVERHGLRLTIYWRDGESSEVTLTRQPTIGTKWTFVEADQLLDLLAKNASQVEIAAKFPDRVWRVIGDKIKNLRDRKTATFTPKPIRDHETHADYLKRVSKNGGHDKTWHTWRKEETAHILEMLDNGATKMELAAAFPYRTWTRLRTKVSELRGFDFEIPGDKPMSYKESFDMYQERLRMETTDIDSCDENTPGGVSSMMIEHCLSFWSWKGCRLASAG